VLAQAAVQGGVAHARDLDEDGGKDLGDGGVAGDFVRPAGKIGRNRTSESRKKEQVKEQVNKEVSKEP
jgi:hypothetical protein